MILKNKGNLFFKMTNLVFKKQAGRGRPGFACPVMGKSTVCRVCPRHWSDRR